MNVSLDSVSASKPTTLPSAAKTFLLCASVELDGMTRADGIDAYVQSSARKA